MIRAHVIRLYPNNVQSTALLRASGVARFSYNWALAWWAEEYEKYTNGERDKAPSALEARKALNAVKRDEFPWMSEVTKCAPQESINDLGKAMKNFFAKRSRYPKFKSRRATAPRFRLTNDQFAVQENRIRIPYIGWVKMAEGLRFEGKIMSVTVSQRAGRWQVSVSVEIPDSGRLWTSKPVGVDVGVHEFVTSENVRYAVPRILRRNQAGLRRAQQTLSRTQKGSKNRDKAHARVARKHMRISNVRQNWLHQTTTDLAKHETVVLEDLHVKGMLRNRRLSKSISDASFAEFRRQLEYKRNVVVIDQWFPSSKTCSGCGAKTKLLTLSMRTWTCEECGITHDRDLNAAINIRNAGGYPVSACGEFLTAALPVSAMQVASVNQEEYITSV